MTPVKANQVFIPGGMPKATYVPREHLGIENRVGDWADGSHNSLLSVSGPTKTGKTVLLKRFFSDAIWISGGVIDSADDFWISICEELELFTDIDLNVTGESSAGQSVEGSVGLGGSSVSGGKAKGTASARGVTRARKISARSAARKALSQEMSAVVVDDFHYIPQLEQRKIVHGLKDLIFEGLPVILITVPHRAHDAVRVEKEMTGRVESIELGQWEVPDLEQIAELGYRALSLTVSSSISRKLADESFGSPHLMQTHCLALARGAEDGGDSVLEPEWTGFFETRAAAASKTAFDLLKQGPRQRTDRMARHLKDGSQTDIYGAVLAAIADTGPRTSLQYEDLRAALRNVLESDIPQRHEVTNILEQMTRIAREKIGGEPVLEYDGEYSTLYIADPFFAYYLRWAPKGL